MTEKLLRDGRYAIVGTLGEGAQGTTFDAVDRREQKPVAIKRFSVKGAASWKDVELAEREAKVLEALSHPALPAHVEHFEEDGALYLVMEKIEGETLLARSRAGAMAREDVVRFLKDASTVLEYLHGRSPPVIHRDINPKNVVRRPDGSHVIVDFGAVRDWLKPEGGSTVVGTFGYMAPEQFQGRALPASDVYAVGATALRLLTGEEPENLPHKGLAIDVAAALGADGDPALRRVLERMLNPDPDCRAKSIAPHLVELEPRKPPPPRAEPRKSETAWKAQKRRSRQREDWDDFRRHRRGRRRHRGPPLAFVAIGLDLATVAVGLALGVFVPLLLTLLSIFFGSALRDAARNVRRAGKKARDAMQEAKHALLRDGFEPPVRDVDGVQAEPLGRVRLDEDELRARVDDESEPESEDWHDRRRARRS